MGRHPAGAPNEVAPNPVPRTTAAMPALDRDRTVMVLGLIALVLFVTQVTGYVKRSLFGSHDRRVVTERVIEVHPHVAVPMAPEAPIPPNHAFEIQRALEAEILAETQARLAEEAALLAEESARLASDGRSEAAISMQEAATRLSEELLRLKREKIETHGSLAAAAAELDAVLAPPAPTIRTETIRVGDREVTVVVKS